MRRARDVSEHAGSETGAPTPNCGGFPSSGAPVPQGRNVYSISASKAPAPAGRNAPGMLVRATQRNHPPSISPRWGWGLRSTLSYKHCVPLGLTLAANLFGLEFKKWICAPHPNRVDGLANSASDFRHEHTSTHHKSAKLFENFKRCRRHAFDARLVSR